MIFLKDTNLAHYSSMRLGGKAKYIIEITDKDDIPDALNFIKNKKLPFICIGGGSNIIFADTAFNGVVLINKIKGYTIDYQNGLVNINSGENWNNIVQKTVANGLYGIESLVLIPGTSGAAPVNNIGAYGQEIKDTLVSLKAYDISKNKFVTLSNSDCQFTYRNSRFKSIDYGKYIICSIQLQLNNNLNNYKMPPYAALTKLLNKKINSRPIDVMNAVINIRKEKLPDPQFLANSGSFFKNPIISNHKANELKTKLKNIKVYDYDAQNKKISAASLIENAGLKNYQNKGIWIYDKQPLVIVNKSSTTYQNLEEMKNYIINVVASKFGLFLETEPEIIN